MLTADEERRRWRREYVDDFLAVAELDHAAIAAPTRTCLGEWARQAKLLADQPSSNFGQVVLQLCKAVECELAVGLGTVQGLECLAKGALGRRAHTLNGVIFDHSLEQRIESKGMKPDFVRKELGQLLSALARLRKGTGAAHGNAELRSATEQDANQARQLVGDILRGVTAAKPGPV